MCCWTARAAPPEAGPLLLSQTTSKLMGCCWIEQQPGQPLLPLPGCCSKGFILPVFVGGCNQLQSISLFCAWDGVTCLEDRNGFQNAAVRHPAHQQLVVITSPGMVTSDFGSCCALPSLQMVLHFPFRLPAFVNQAPSWGIFLCCLGVVLVVPAQVIKACMKTGNRTPSAKCLACPPVQFGMRLGPDHRKRSLDLHP